MRGRPAWILVLGVLAGAVLWPAAPGHAATIWDGDAGRAPVSATFGISNCDPPGSITAVTDPDHGRVWRFDKPAGSNRCEGHGIRTGGGMYRFSNGGTYYFGWSSKLSSTVDNNATFQWKSYGDHIQNYPVVLKMSGGRFTLLQRQPDQVYYPWSRPISANSWNHIVLGIHTSDALTGGWVELYLNGVQQTFSNGATRWPCRTWDSSNDPKWGVYGAQGSSVTNFVDDLKVGTSYADVRAGAPPASAAPSRSPSASASPSGSAPPSAPASVDGSEPASTPAAALGTVGGTVGGSASLPVWVIGGGLLAVLAGAATLLWYLQRRHPVGTGTTAPAHRHRRG
jgi:hypothetical protein